MPPWQKKTNRLNALSVVRSIMRNNGQFPERQPAREALAILDDLFRKEPDHRVSKWYEWASDNEISLFIKDWSQWCKTELKKQLREYKINHPG